MTLYPFWCCEEGCVCLEAVDGIQLVICPNHIERSMSYSLAFCAFILKWKLQVDDVIDII